MVPTSPTLPPKDFGGYQRGREIGRGASGHVFECRREGDAGVYAVKTLNMRGMRLSPHGERERERLQRELAILRTLPPHPRIVRMIDSVEEGDWFFLVLELVPGGDLFGTLVSRAPDPRRRRLDEREASFVFWQLADGLEFLHREGVIHRDLKLENVLVASQELEGPHVLYSVKISDFGLSKSIGVGQANHSSVGTMRYAAPEVLEGRPYDFRADLWSLGILLYVLLQGSYPNDQPQRLSQQVLTSIVAGADAGHSARSIVEGLLQLDPTQRSSLEDLRSRSWSGESSQEGRTVGEADGIGRLGSRESSSLWGTRSLFGSEEMLVAPDAPGATPNMESMMSLPSLGTPRRQQSSPGQLAKQGSSLLPFAEAVLAMASEEQDESGSLPDKSDAAGESAPAKRPRIEEGQAAAGQSVQLAETGAQ